MCQNYVSESGCTNNDKCRLRHNEAEDKPSKKSKKSGAKGSASSLKESIQLGCVSEDSYPRKSILREIGKLGSKHAVNFSKLPGTKLKIRERERVHREELSKSVCLMSVVLEETLHQEGCARRAPRDLAKKFKSSRIRTRLRFILLLKLRWCRHRLQKDQRSENS